MLVTFKTNAAHPDINMFGTAATSLLKLMGQSGNVPGAIMAEDIPPAIDKLKQGLAERDDDETVEPGSEEDSGSADDEEEEGRSVSLTRRATPLLKMLEAAREEGKSVRWDE